MKNQQKNKMAVTLFIVAAVLLIISIFKRKAITWAVQNTGKDVATKAANLIKQFEGFAPKSFWDYKQYTWGYGTKTTALGLTITKEQAEIELVKELAPLIKQLQATGVKLTDNQSIAFISFGYNLGASIMLNLVGRLKNGEPMESVKTSFLKYINAGGKPLKGLIERRKREASYL